MDMECRNTLRELIALIGAVDYQTWVANALCAVNFPEYMKFDQASTILHQQISNDAQSFGRTDIARNKDAQGFAVAWPFP